MESLDTSRFYYLEANSNSCISSSICSLPPCSLEPLDSRKDIGVRWKELKKVQVFLSALLAFCGSFLWFECGVDVRWILRFCRAMWGYPGDKQEARPPLLGCATLISASNSALPLLVRTIIPVPCSAQRSCWNEQNVWRVGTDTITVIRAFTIASLLCSSSKARH